MDVVLLFSSFAPVIVKVGVNDVAFMSTIDLEIV